MFACFRPTDYVRRLQPTTSDRVDPRVRFLQLAACSRLALSEQQGRGPFGPPPIPPRRDDYGAQTAYARMVDRFPLADVATCTAVAVQPVGVPDDGFGAEIATRSLLVAWGPA